MSSHARRCAAKPLSGFSVLVLLLSQPALRSARAVAQAPDTGTLRVNVDLMSVEVAVTDKKAQHFPKLSKEDFKLWLDGREQEILTADEVRLGATGEKGHSAKVLLILFDDSLTSLSQIPTSRKAARTYITKHMKPGDLSAVVVHGAKVRIVQNFTPETSKVVEAIEKSTEHVETSEPGLASPGLKGSEPRVDPIFGRTGQNLPSRSGLPNLSQTLNVLSSSMLRVKGRKAILVFSISSNNFSPFGTQPDSGYFDEELEKTIEASKSSAIPIYRIDPQNLGDWSARLDQIDTELSNYYVLGFKSVNSDPKRKSRRLLVKTVAKGARLNYRSELRDLDSQDPASVSKDDQPLMAALTSSATPSQLPVSFRTAYFYSSKNRVRVAISANVPSASLKFKKEKGQLVCSLNVMGLALAENGGVAARFAEPYRVARNRKDGHAQDSEVFYQRMIKLSPGKYTIKLAISDEDGKIGGAEQSLLVPHMPSEKLAMSSLVVTQQMTMLPALIQDIHSQLLQDDDPLIFKSYQVSVPADTRLDRQKPMVLFYKLYNAGDQQTQHELQAKVQLIDEKGNMSAIPAIPLNTDAVSSGDGQLTIALSLPTDRIQPGKYKLMVETTDRISHQAVTGSTEIEIR